MKKLFALVISLLIVASCDNTNPGSLERLYYENSELSAPEDDYGTWVLWEEGDKTAIRFAYVHPDEENIADDELTEFFWIELPSDVTEFNISTSNDLPQTEIEFYYVRACFCAFETFRFLRNDISGQKLSTNQWRVSFDIVVVTNNNNYEYHLSDSGIYVFNEAL